MGEKWPPVRGYTHISEKPRNADCRGDLGDQATGAKGKNRRPVGWVDDPKPLTVYDPTHPYMKAMYD